MFQSNKYINTLNSIKVAYNNRLRKTAVPYNKHLIILLNRFIDISYIQSYEIRGTYILITLNNQLNCWSSAKIISTTAKKYYISYKKLHLLTRYDFSTVIILHTSQGILTSQQAITNKIGGQILFVFFL